MVDSKLSELDSRRECLQTMAKSTCDMTVYIQMEKLCLQVFTCQQVTRRNYRNRFLAKVCIEDTNQTETSCMNLKQYLSKFALKI